MPYEITLDHLPAGYAQTSGRAGDDISVRVCDFFSSEDGQKLIYHLEGLPRQIIAKLPIGAKAYESSTDNLLAVIRKDKTATVHYNEFRPIVIARAKSTIKAGGAVHTDNLLDLDRVKLDGLNIPADTGVCYVFSFGWRKGFFFDFGPIFENNPQLRKYDLENVFAQCHARVLFQHLFSIEEDTWKEMFRQRWFPFIHLKQEQIRSLVNYARSKLPLDDFLNPIRENLLETLAERLPGWEKDSIIGTHFEFINTAFKHYTNGDYLSASAILYPRIEGIMRTLALAVNPTPSFKQENLAEINATADGAINNPVSLLLPTKFKRYLTEVYFAAFDPKNPQGVSRHTVSHGVVDSKFLDCKAATLAFLVLLQISSVSAFAIKPTH